LNGDGSGLELAALAPDEADESEELGLPGPPADCPAVQAVAVRAGASGDALDALVTSWTWKPCPPVGNYSVPREPCRNFALRSCGTPVVFCRSVPGDPAGTLTSFSTVIE